MRRASNLAARGLFFGLVTLAGCNKPAGGVDDDAAPSASAGQTLVPPPAAPPDPEAATDTTSSSPEPGPKSDAPPSTGGIDPRSLAGIGRDLSVEEAYARFGKGQVVGLGEGRTEQWLLPSPMPEGGTRTLLVLERAKPVDGHARIVSIELRGEDGFDYGAHGVRGPLIDALFQKSLDAAVARLGAPAYWRRYPDLVNNADPKYAGKWPTSGTLYWTYTLDDGTEAHLGLGYADGKTTAVELAFDPDREIPRIESAPLDTRPPAPAPPPQAMTVLGGRPVAPASHESKSFERSVGRVTFACDYFEVSLDDPKLTAALNARIESDAILDGKTAKGDRYDGEVTFSCEPGAVTQFFVSYRCSGIDGRMSIADLDAATGGSPEPTSFTRNWVLFGDTPRALTLAELGWKPDVSAERLVKTAITRAFEEDGAEPSEIEGVLKAMPGHDTWSGNVAYTKIPWLLTDDALEFPAPMDWACDEVCADGALPLDRAAAWLAPSDAAASPAKGLISALRRLQADPDEVDPAPSPGPETSDSGRVDRVP